MNFWVQAILLPYVAEVRARLQRQITAVLIMDGLGSHSTPQTIDSFRDGDVRVILLPPHTTDLYRPLDLCLFGLLKLEYRIAGALKTELQEKLSRKIEKVVKAWHRACSPGNVLAAWKGGEFVHTFRDGTLSGIGINETVMTMRIAG
jgi:hypothetical protein